MVRYTSEDKNYIDFHNDKDRGRICGFSIDLTFSQNCDSTFLLKDVDKDSIILESKAGVPGRITIFKISSNLAHAVTPTLNDDRIALTGWVTTEKKESSSVNK